MTNAIRFLVLVLMLVACAPPADPKWVAAENLKPFKAQADAAEADRLAKNEEAARQKEAERAKEKEKEVKREAADARYREMMKTKCAEDREARIIDVAEDVDDWLSAVDVAKKIDMKWLAAHCRRLGDLPVCNAQLPKGITMDMIATTFNVLEALNDDFGEEGYAVRPTGTNLDCREADAEAGYKLVIKRNEPKWMKRILEQAAAMKKASR